MASLLQISEAIETGKIRMSSGDEATALEHDPNSPFNHSNPADWLHKRANPFPSYPSTLANEAVPEKSPLHVSLLRKCE